MDVSDFSQHCLDNMAGNGMSLPCCGFTWLMAILCLEDNGATRFEQLSSFCWKEFLPQSFHRRTGREIRDWIWPSRAGETLLLCSEQR